MKWINWKTVSTTLLLALLSWSGTWLYAQYTEYKDMLLKVHSHEEQLAQVQKQGKLLEQIAADVAGIKRGMQTVTGRAAVRDIGPTAVMRINTLSKAGSYASMSKARITNIGSSDNPSAAIQIEGTFQNSDEGYLAVISARAAALLDIQGTGGKIRIEPVEEK